MVLPAYKVVALVIKTLSKPLITYTKQIHLKSGPKHPFMRQSFIRLGNSYHSWIRSINMRVLNLQKSEKYEQINDDLAIEKGIELSYEIFMYLIIIVFSVYELWASLIESREKKKHLEKTIKNSQNNLENLLKSISDYEQQLKNKQKKIEIIPQTKQANMDKIEEEKKVQILEKEDDDAIKNQEQQKEEKAEIIWDVLDEILEEFVDEHMDGVDQ